MGLTFTGQSRGGQGRAAFNSGDISSGELQSVGARGCSCEWIRLGAFWVGGGWASGSQPVLNPAYVKHPHRIKLTATVSEQEVRHQSLAEEG